MKMSEINLNIICCED